MTVTEQTERRNRSYATNLIFTVFLCWLVQLVPAFASEWHKAKGELGTSFLMRGDANLRSTTPHEKRIKIIRGTSPNSSRPAPTDPRSGLLDLIADAESREGYDSINNGTSIKPPKPPSQLRIKEVLAWIDTTPGQPHAIGRYQFIPATFRRLVKKLSLSQDTMFNSQTQDSMATALIAEAGYAQFQAGKISAQRFMDRLARIWAGLPLASGKSAYEGYAGNRATLSRQTYERRFLALFSPLPKR